MKKILFVILVLGLVSFSSCDRGEGTIGSPFELIDTHSDEINLVMVEGERLGLMATIDSHGCSASLSFPNLKILPLVQDVLVDGERIRPEDMDAYDNMSYKGEWGVIYGDFEAVPQKMILSFSENPTSEKRIIQFKINGGYRIAYVTIIQEGSE